ncbi:MAG: acyl-CoA dehydrogenase family protein [Alphaproteobacteria bacterium]|jgi:alkylation response protein AidB-like acyl-CoA dehydrogenase
MKVFERLDASHNWAEDEAAVIESVSRLAREEIAPRAAEYDKTKTFPWTNVEAINSLGLNGLFIPEAYGGAGMRYEVYIECARLIAAACASTGIIWSTVFHAIKPVIDFGSDDQKQRFLPQIASGGLAALCITEPDAGSDATGMRTKFIPEGDKIRIEGGKRFISNGDVADVFLVFGKWSEINDAKAAISALVIEKGAPGLETLRLEEKLGHRAASTAELAFNGILVPRENLLKNPGDGLGILFAALNKSRPSVAAHALGIARAAFEAAVDYINERRQSGRRIVDFQGIQFMLADIATDLAMCERWLFHVSQMLETGVDDVGVEASMLKMRASDLAMKAADMCVQLHGGYGYVEDYAAERFFRDAKITQIWEGTNQVHQQLIGRSFAKR